MSNLWRTKLRSIKPGVNHEGQVSYCLNRNVIGIGWGGDIPHGASFEQVLDLVQDGRSKKKAQDTIRRFAGAEDGEFVWTRDTFGRYLLCRLEGPWRFENTPEAAAVDIHQVRDVEWMSRPASDLEVPGAVIRCFVGPGSSFSRVTNKTARLLTERIWRIGCGEPPEAMGVSATEVLTDLLDPYDVEDLIYIWLQMSEGYIALPRARARDTPVYEFSMLHRETGRRGIVQVKTGQEPVPLDQLAKAVTPDTDAYAFATSGNYDGSPSGIRIIERDELLSFVEAHPEYLPARTRWMFDLAS